MRTLANDYDRTLDDEIIPELIQWVEAERHRDLQSLDAAGWRELWELRRMRVLGQYGAKLMLPSLLAAMALEDLRQFNAENFWDEEPEQLANELSSAHQPDQTLIGTQGLWDIAHGNMTALQWIDRFGHRAPEEFDLATPRWRERPDATEQMAAHLKDAQSPIDRHEARVKQCEAKVDELRKCLSRSVAREFDERIQLARRYMRFREDGKFYLMLGYDLLRDMALEAGRRLDIGDDVFLLREEELFDALSTGIAPLHLLEQRRTARAAEAELDLPTIITEEGITELGEPTEIETTGAISAFPISSGTASGPARIILSPEEAGDPGDGYILVCPSTDPNWTPLFARAAGLVIECGGMLSHGAVVAREMGIPAVVREGATRLLDDGETVTIDGDRGNLLRANEKVAEENASEDAASADPTDARIAAAMSPPPPGRIERACGGWAKASTLVWTVFFLTMFLLPGTWLYDTSMSALDFCMLPLVGSIGRVATVAVVAAGLALFSIVAQRLLTDNRRLAEAKRRASVLRKEASRLPAGSHRRGAFEQAGSGVQYRLLKAAIFPLLLILGPMVMIFLWFPARVDPASLNAEPGATIFVTAMVCGDTDSPITLTHDPMLQLEDRTPASQSITLIRPPLERLQQRWSSASTVTPDTPWELRAAAEHTRREMLGDLGRFLDGPMPSRDVSWTLHTSKDKDGRFLLSVETEGFPPIHTAVVLGSCVAPEVKEDLGDGKGPVQVVRPTTENHPIELVKVAYREQLVKDGNVFWPPVEWMVTSWLPGWLIVYLLAYLPIMIILKFVFRVP